VFGNRTRIKVVKNKVSPPFQQCEFDIIYGKGVNRLGELVDLGVHLKLIDKSGSWYSYNETKIGQGRDNVITFLEENPDVSDVLEIAVRQHYRL
jgi:recombination protein RecA